MTTITCWNPSIPTFDGLSLIECEELDGLLSWWMNGGAGHSDAGHEVYDHIHTCPTCTQVAGSMPKVTAHIPASWLPGKDMPKASEL